MWQYATDWRSWKRGGRTRNVSVGGRVASGEELMGSALDVQGRGASDPIGTVNDRPAVFISYSRKDLGAAKRLRDQLIALHYEAYLDLADILPGEPWQDRLSELIQRSDAVLFALSPAAISSDVVDWEVNEAERLGKRIVPVVLMDPNPALVPGRIRRLNYVFMRNEEEWTTNFPKLNEALKADIGWIRTHTRLGDLAIRWAQSRRSDGLLRGRAIDDAEQWLRQRPLSSDAAIKLHLEFIHASRRLAARSQKIVALISMVVALVSIALLTVAGYQRQLALASESKALAMLASDQGRIGNVANAVLLSLAGLPPSSATWMRPMPAEITASLTSALLSLKERVVLQGHSDKVTAVIANSGRFFVTGSDDGQAIIWSERDPDNFRRLLGHEGTIEAIAATHDERLLIAGGSDGSLRSWRMSQGEPFSAVRRHQGLITSVAAHSRLPLVASGSIDGFAYVFGIGETDLFEAARVKHSATVKSLAFHPVLPIVLTASSDGTAILTSVGPSVGSVVIDPALGPLVGARFSPLGDTIALFAEDGSIEIRRSEQSDATVRRLRGHSGPVRSVAFSHDGQHLFSGGEDGTIRFWRLDTGIEVRQIDVGSPVWRLKMANKLPLLSATARSGKLLLLDVDEQGSPIHLVGHTDWIYDAAFNNDDTALYSVSADRSVRVWSIGSSSLAITKKVSSSELLSLMHVPSSSSLIVGTQSGALGVADDSGEYAFKWIDGTGSINDLSIDTQEKHFAVARENGLLQIWQLPTLAVVHSWSVEATDFQAVAFFNSDRNLLTGSSDGTLRFFAIGAAHPVRVIKLRTSGILSLQLDPLGEAVLVGFLDGMVGLYRYSTGQRIIEWRAHRDAARAVMDSAGKRVLSASNDGTAAVWDLATGALINRLNGHAGPVTQIASTDGGRVLVTSSLDMTARVWDGSTFELIGLNDNHRSGVTRVVPTKPDGNFASVDAGGVMQRWRVIHNKRDLIKFGEENVPRCALTNVALAGAGEVLARGKCNVKRGKIWQ